ncbi:MAG TPA: hypothetical protein VHE30_06340 [Polyangiaceae bacterium]|nr:hypothetical protein [Polyangiaceae bacterium]
MLGPALISAWALTHVPAHAEDAQALFDEGLQDMRAGRFKIGCALIKQSLEIDARAGTVFTLAECYSKAGKYASAVAFYDRYLQVFETMTAEQRESQKARAELSRTERTRLVGLVAWLTVSLPENAPPGVVVTMDGEPFQSTLFGVATAADPTPHVFTTRAPDGPLIEQRVELSPGERKAIVLSVRDANGELPPNVEGPSPYEVPPDQPGDGEPAATPKPSPWFWVAGGIGAAGLVTGTVTGVMLLGDRSTILSNCRADQRNPDGSIPCTPEGAKAASRAQNTLAPITTVALGVGAAGMIAAVAILLTDSAPKQTVTGATPALAVAPGLATVGVRGAF